MPLILPGNVGSATAATGFNVANSLRFAGAARDTYLTATFGSAPTLATKNTISLWFKRSKLDTLQQLYAANGNTANIIVNSNNTIAFYTNSGQLLGPRLYRDTSAWMHFVFTFDSTQGTAANRFKVYINGVEETSFNNTAYPGLNVASELGVNGTLMEIGTRSNHDRIFEGYMAETAFVDGQALDATSFGEFDSDSGIWKPIDISGLTFGNNGFYLEYKGTGTSANSSGIGADTSGNDLHFAVNGFTAADQSTDTCTNNFATFNPLVNNANDNMTLSEGNLVATSPDSSWNASFSTFGVTKGKWYWEAKLTNTSNNYYHGVAGSNIIVANAENPMNENGFTGFYNASGGEILKDGDVTSNDYGTLSTNDILGVALNADDYQITFYKNGSALVSNYALSTTGRDTLFVLAVSAASGVSSYNFGSPAFAISSGNTDGNGYGNFEYAPPSGYYALCTKNLSEYG